MDNALTNPLPHFVKVEGTNNCLRLISQQVPRLLLGAKVCATRYLYYRDGGDYEVGLEEKFDGFLYVDEPDHPFVHGKRLLEVTEGEWRTSNGKYAPGTVPNPHVRKK